MPTHKNIASFLLSILITLSASSTFAQDDDFFEDDFFFFDEEEDSNHEEMADPFESFNRAIFSFNDKLYRGLLKPIAVAFRVVPEPARISIDNFFDNLKSPVSSANALIQLDIENSVTEISRFIINSTVGVAGLFDPAKNMGLHADEEDLGQTLAHYGVGNGFYLVIPFLGSSSLRDAFSSTIGNNIALNPLLKNLNAYDFTAIKLADGETTLSLDDDTYEAFYDSSLDPYIFFRSAYAQNRSGQIQQ